MPKFVQYWVASFLIYFFNVTEIEDAKKSTENAALQSPPPSATATGATPDYAAGLSATPTYAPATPQPTVPAGSEYSFKYIICQLKT